MWLTSGGCADIALQVGGRSVCITRGGCWRLLTGWTESHRSPSARASGRECGAHPRVLQTSNESLLPRCPGAGSLLEQSLLPPFRQSLQHHVSCPTAAAATLERSARSPTPTTGTRRLLPSPGSVALSPCRSGTLGYGCAQLQQLLRALPTHRTHGASGADAAAAVGGGGGVASQPLLWGRS